MILYLLWPHFWALRDHLGTQHWFGSALCLLCPSAHLFHLCTCFYRWKWWNMTEWRVQWSWSGCYLGFELQGIILVRNIDLVVLYVCTAQVHTCFTFFTCFTGEKGNMVEWPVQWSLSVCYLIFGALRNHIGTQHRFGGALHLHTCFTFFTCFHLSPPVLYRSYIKIFISNHFCEL